MLIGKRKRHARRSLRNEQRVTNNSTSLNGPLLPFYGWGYPNGNGSVSSLCSFAEPATHDLPQTNWRDRSSSQFRARRLWTHSSRAFSEERHMDRIIRTGSAVKQKWNNLGDYGCS
ncbi:hypothetical protein CDAR_555901 [Caerostris darwini]|uniref:Uncharacterized protein n=1 Tax=Caerostris darwini TaxID=1538125 RepID=A0AAV4NAD2_9ARAC|nr:hypothetical protein CDAR_555901 [Caerostris darwini]